MSSALCILAPARAPIKLTKLAASVISTSPSVRLVSGTRDEKVSAPAIFYPKKGWAPQPAALRPSYIISPPRLAFCVPVCYIALACDSLFGLGKTVRSTKIRRRNRGEAMQTYDLIVIGSGPAGQSAAIQAAKLGKRVALSEKREVVGGACIN